VWHVYALILDKLGDRAGANHAIAVAMRIATDNYHAADVRADYNRLGGADIAKEKAAAKSVLDAKIARSRHFWDLCSLDERRVLVMRGGKSTTRDHNVGDNLGPKRIETYDAAGYHKETWWYYGLSGENSAEAFTFINGHFQSHYGN